jgi:hypothetical protein
MNVSQSTTVLAHQTSIAGGRETKMFFFCIVARIGDDETFWRSERVVLHDDLFVYTHPSPRPENPDQESGTIEALQGIASGVVGPCLSGFEWAAGRRWRARNKSCWPLTGHLPFFVARYAFLVGLGP